MEDLFSAHAEAHAASLAARDADSQRVEQLLRDFIARVEVAKIVPGELGIISRATGWSGLARVPTLTFVPLQRNGWIIGRQTGEWRDSLQIVTTDGQLVHADVPDGAPANAKHIGFPAGAIPLDRAPISFPIASSLVEQRLVNGLRYLRLL